MSDELQELQEGAEHAHQNPTMAPVSLTMAVLAVLVAAATLLGHRAHTKEMMTQAEMHDQWAFYQAKNIRQHEDDLFLAGLLKLLAHVNDFDLRQRALFDTVG